MAATNSGLSSEIPAKKEDEFNEFYTEVSDVLQVLWNYATSLSCLIINIAVCSVT